MAGSGSDWLGAQNDNAHQVLVFKVTQGKHMFYDFVFAYLLWMLHFVFFVFVTLYFRTYEEFFSGELSDFERREQIRKAKLAHTRTSYLMSLSSETESELSATSDSD